MAYGRSIDFGETETDIMRWTREGLCFGANTGKFTSVGTIAVGISVFNPANSGKDFLVFDAQGAVSAAGFMSLGLVTTDPAYTSPMNAYNLRAGGPATAGSCTYQNSTTTTSNNVIDEIVGGANVNAMLRQGACILLTPGNGVIALVSTVSNSWIFGFKWAELP